MQNKSTNDWRKRCRQLGLDPQEVKAVSKRYDMYKSFTDEKTGESLSLDRWYKWYRIEKLSEGHAMQTPPDQSCSVGPEVAPDTPVVSEQDFFLLLLDYRQTQN